jgi:hypothetical protein
MGQQGGLTCRSGRLPLRAGELLWISAEIRAPRTQWEAPVGEIYLGWGGRKGGMHLQALALL